MSEGKDEEDCSAETYLQVLEVVVDGCKHTPWVPAQPCCGRDEEVQSL